MSRLINDFLFWFLVLVLVFSVLDFSSVRVSDGTTWSQRQTHRRRKERPKDLKVVLKGDGFLMDLNPSCGEIQSVMDSSDVGVSDGTTWSQRQPHRRCQEHLKVP